MKVIFDMPETLDPKVTMELLFTAWKNDALDKWGVYPVCLEMIRAKEITRKDVIKAAKRICGIHPGVVEMRLNDLVKMESPWDPKAEYTRNKLEVA
tara:strand:+ start:1558 stop:1845 length:288 start_codon:yes stop_codon:yes gene_type:complete